VLPALLQNELQAIHTDYATWKERLNGSRVFHQAIQLSKGKFSPALRKEVWERKGHIERFSQLMSGNKFASNYDQISGSAILSYRSGTAFVILHQTEFNDDLLYALLPDRVKWVLVEMAVVRYGYAPSDFVNRQLRKHPRLRTAMAIAAPLAMLCGTASLKVGGAHLGPEGMADLSAGGLGTAADEVFFDPLTGQLADPRFLIPVPHEPAGSAHSLPYGAIARLWPKQSADLDIGVELEDSSASDSLGVTISIHRAVVFQVTPLNLTRAGGLFSRRLLIGVRSFGVEGGEAHNYVSFYRALNASDKHSVKMAIARLANPSSYDAWLLRPFYWEATNPLRLDPLSQPIEEFFKAGYFMHSAAEL
jgi:hypothetical protein